MTTAILLLLLLMLKYKDTKKYKLGDLFEMQTGVVEDKYLLKVSETDDDVSLLRINSFSEDGRLVAEAGATERMNLKERKEKLEATEDLKTIGENKIIQDNDFLLYTRGKPRGFSALQFLSTNSEKYAASHHFIYLRPRTSVIDIYMPYLHLMMELYTRKDLTGNYGRKLKKHNSTNAIGNSFSIKELKEVEIELLKDLSEQEKVVEAYEKYRKEYEKSLMNFQKLGDEILQNNFI